MKRREMIRGGYRLLQNIAARGQTPPLSNRTLKRRKAKQAKVQSRLIKPPEQLKPTT